MQGPAVPWTGGIWSPQQGQQGAAAGEPSGRKLLARRGGAASSVPRAGVTTSLVRRLAGGARRARVLLQGTGPASDIWQRYTRENNTLYRGPSLATTPLVAVGEEDCAAECAKQPNCTMWALCPASETKG